MNDTATDVATFWALDFDLEVPCEYDGHIEGSDGHVPDQLASWLYQCPSCKGTVSICNGGKEWLLSNCLPHLMAFCLWCDQLSFFGEIIWTPIRTVS